jgi:CARDB
VNFSATTRRLVSTALVIGAIGAQLIAPAAEAAPPPPPGPIRQPPTCLACLQFKPDLYLSTMYQRDASGNSISGALAGQTVVYPITIGNKGILGASGVTVLWGADTTTFSSQGWQFTSYTADSGFVCFTPPEFPGMQVECVNGSVAAGQLAHITLTMQAPTTAGQHKIGVRTDFANVIAEMDETNNDGCCLTLWT